VWSGEAFVLHDLGSANGTTLNYQRLSEPRPLRDGDVLKLGGMELLFRIVSNTGSDDVVAYSAYGGESQVLTFFSSKGGVGTTTLAVNTALRLRHLTGQAVVLVDLSLELGSVANHLDLNVRRSIEGLARLSVVAPETLEWVMATHDSGVDVLPAPASPESAEVITSDLIQQVLPLLKARYRWVVVDTGSSFSEVNLSIMEQSDVVFHVTAPDVATLNATKTARVVLTRALGDVPERKLVLNNIHARTRLGRSEMQKTLGADIDLVVGHSDAVLGSIDHGKPLALTTTTDPIIHAIDTHIRQLAPVRAPAATLPLGSGFWAKLPGLR
jgi:pilus assembly protein CpaE